MVTLAAYAQSPARARAVSRESGRGRGADADRTAAPATQKSAESRFAFGGSRLPSLNENGKTLERGAPLSVVCPRPSANTVCIYVFVP